MKNQLNTRFLSRLQGLGKAMPGGKTLGVTLTSTVMPAIVLTWLIVEGIHLGILHAGRGSLILVLLMIAVHAPLMVLSARRMNRAEERIHYLNRLYATLSQVNRTIARVRNRQELLDAICTIAVQAGQFRLAWVGWLDPETGQVTPMSEYGCGELKLPFRQINARETPFKQGLIGTCLSTGNAAFSNDIQNDPNMEHWCKVAIQDGYHSAAVVPIQQGGKIVALLNLYASDIGYFLSREEQNLLEEMGLDIGFALDSMEAEAERKRAENQLRYQAHLLANVNDAIIASDENYILKAWNPAAERIYGWKAEEVLGRNGLEILETVFMEAAAGEVRRQIAQAGRYVGETTQLRKDGRRIHVEAASMVLRDDRGRITGYVSVNRDISERKRAEEALRAGEERYRNLVENMNDIVMEVDAQGKYTYLSSNYTALTGYMPEEKIHDPAFSRVHPDDLPEVVEKLNKALHMERQRATYRVQQKSGEWHWLETTGQPYRTADGEVHVICVARDITERKKVEQALQLANTRFLRMVNSNIIGIVIGSTDGRIMLANDYFLRLLNLTQQGFLEGGVDWRRYTPPEWLPVDERAIQELCQRGVCDPYEKEFVRADGTRAAVLITEAVLNDPDDQVLALVLDITERKQAQEKLRQSEERYRLISENTADVIWVLDPLSGRFKYISPSVERLRGYTPAEIMKAPFSEALTPESRQLIEKLLAEHLPAFIAKGSGTESFITEVDQPRKDGSIVHTEVTTTCMFNQQGEVEIIGVTRDITARKRAEQVLREREERLRLSLEAAGQGLYDLNVQTGETVVNREYAEMLGYEHETFVETNAFWIERLHPDDRESVAKAYLDYINGLLPEYRIEFRQRTKDGKWKWILSLGKLIERDPDGKPLRMLGTHTDITERKQAEEALKRNEHVLRLFVEHSPASIAMLDRDMRYLVASRRYLMDYRLGDQDLTSRSHYEVFPEIPERWRQVHRRCLLGEILKEEEDPFPRYDGTLDWVRWEIHPWYEESGSIGGIILFSEVITDRKQVQDDLRLLNLSLEQRVMERTMELSHANRAKDEFLANMSHELRTPLNTVLGLSESLLEQRRGPLNEKQIQSIKLIAASGQHLLELINDILEISKIEAGKLELRPTTVSVREICESSMNFIRQLALKKSISVELKYDIIISTLYADPQRLKQILINLLTNAVKFTREGGSVSLEVVSDPERDQILFSVTDNGIGIAIEDLKKLFTPFTQLDSSLARQYAGTGLGLALVQKLTDMHGGSVQVESAVNKGSCFTVALPMNQAKCQPSLVKKAVETVSAGQDAGLPATPVRHGIVMLAEDNLINAEMVVEYLEAYGYRVVVAQDGEEVLEKVNKTSPDIILMDIQMPRLDGLEATRRLKTDPRFASTPIVALTALAMPGDKERCLEAGVDEYLSKPVSLRLLIKVIAKFTGQSL